MMHGTWDSNACNVLNDNAINEISRYIDTGKGVLTGHDTIGFRMGTTLGLSKIADKFNIKRGYWQGINRLYTFNGGIECKKIEKKHKKRA